jgi:hypothetical protein
MLHIFGINLQDMVEQLQFIFPIIPPNLLMLFLIILAFFHYIKNKIFNTATNVKVSMMKSKHPLHHLDASSIAFFLSS